MSKNRKCQFKIDSLSETSLSMTTAFRILSIVVAVVLLVTVLVASPVLGAPVTVAEDDVEWAAANGDNISFVAPNSTGNFFIQDAALETIQSAEITTRGKQ